MKKLENLISTYNDFPKKGIKFRDVLGILQNPDVFKELIQEMSASSIIRNCEAIISIDARDLFLVLQLHCKLQNQ